MNNEYEAPFAEIVEVDLVAVMTWSGIHRTFDQTSTVENTETDPEVFDW